MNMPTVQQYDLQEKDEFIKLDMYEFYKKDIYLNNPFQSNNQ